MDKATVVWEEQHASYKARMVSLLDLPGTLLGSEGHQPKTTLGSNSHSGQKPESQRHRKMEGKSGE